MHLESLKKIIKAKIVISENVATGNINQRIVETLESEMDSRET